MIDVTADIGAVWNSNGRKRLTRNTLLNANISIVKFKLFGLPRTRNDSGAGTMILTFHIHHIT